MHKKISAALIIFLLFLLLYTSQAIFSHKQTNNISKNILTILEDHILIYDIDKKSIDFENNITLSENIPTGFDQLLHKISYFVQDNNPIIFTMVGFPYKSMNTQDKVLASQADAAERYSLEFLQNILDKIKNIYTPGAQLLIFTDGIIFCDIEKTSDETVINYEDALKTMSFDMPNIKIVTMRDVCPNKTPEHIRTIISNMHPSVKKFSKTVCDDKKVQEDIDILTKRITFELAPLSLSSHEIKTLCTQEIHRSMQYSHFLQNYRPKNSIRCSVHYQSDVSNKLGLKLSNSFITPWHGVLVETNGHYTIQHLKDINQSFYKIMYWDINGLSLAYLKQIT